jgi:atlastin
VCIVSIAGVFRKGKSFLMNFFLRYLSKSGQDDWIGCNDDDLTGFAWENGSHRVTTGIWMWSEPFILRREGTGEEIAILLMDSQGTFDSKSTTKDNVKIFSLSLMISSIQIYNMAQNLQEDDLQHLNVFTDYGGMAQEGRTEAPFQKLIFLIRDWSYPYENAYGYDGGAQLLSEALEVNEEQHDELRNSRNKIKKCFANLDCFLMPHPGYKVSATSDFKGKLSDIENEFKDCVEKFVVGTFKRSLSVKKINDREIKTFQLLEYFQEYCKVFESDQQPEIMSILTATTTAINLNTKTINLNAKADALKSYKQKLDKYCGDDRQYINAKDLKTFNSEIRDKSIEMFSSGCNLGEVTISEEYKKELGDEMDEYFESCVKNNKSKIATNLFMYIPIFIRIYQKLIAVSSIIMILISICSVLVYKEYPFDFALLFDFESHKVLIDSTINSITDFKASAIDSISDYKASITAYFQDKIRFYLNLTDIPCTEQNH